MTQFNQTIVTGLWNINRINRPFDIYLNHFTRLLDINQKLFIYTSAEYEKLVWEKRSRHNTFVKIYEIEDIKRLYSPFWEKTQQIRKSNEWLSQADWLKLSPQANNEMYNPIVQSKMFLLNDVTIWNPFDTDYFFWLDAGILNTVPYDHIVQKNVLSTLSKYSNPFLFLSYPYNATQEVHGFDLKAMNMYARQDVKYVCRGGLFGGHKLQINETNAEYYALLDIALNNGYMGTEESLFTIMSYLQPKIYQRYALDENGLIGKFTEALLNNKVDIIAPINNSTYKKYTNNELKKLKTYIYVLTFNFSEQLEYFLHSLNNHNDWMHTPKIFVLDNSTLQLSKIHNKNLCHQYSINYIDIGHNIGICGGRQFAAQHFHDSDADFMVFFEDDMILNSPEQLGNICRNGFQQFVPDLYNKIHKIMLKDNFDFLKLSFTEVYFDNDKQCSWYNVPQDIRTTYWPNYDKLPISGLDPNVPLTEFKNIRNLDGLTYIDGEIYYANWPMIVSKDGNKKMFIDKKWERPFEQTWMSHMYQLTKKGILKPAILLASPVTHHRIKFYANNERKEN